MLREYRAKKVRVVDGDTAVFDVDVGFYTKVTIMARLAGVDTPERGEPDFALATSRLDELLFMAADHEGWIKIKTGKTGKFGRWIVHIDGVTDVMAERWPYE